MVPAKGSRTFRLWFFLFFFFLSSLPSPPPLSPSSFVELWTSSYVRSFPPPPPKKKGGGCIFNWFGQMGLARLKGRSRSRVLRQSVPVHEHVWAVNLLYLFGRRLQGEGGRGGGGWEWQALWLWGSTSCRRACLQMESHTGWVWSPTMMVLDSISGYSVFVFNHQMSVLQVN